MYYAEIKCEYYECGETIKELLPKLESYVYYGAMCFIKNELCNGKIQPVVSYTEYGFTGQMVVTQRNYSHYCQMYKV